MQTGIWAGDVERLSAASAFPRLTEWERVHRSLLVGALKSRRGARGMGSPRLASFAGGMGALCLAMASALGERVRLNAQVTRLAHGAEGWTLQTPAGGVAASRVVLALPPWEASGLVRPFDGGLADALAQFPSVPVAVVHLGYRPALEPAPEGFGFLAPSGQHRELLGTLYASSAFPFRAPEGSTLLSVLLGGAHRPELVAQPDARLVETARAELAALLGLKRAPQLSEVFRWPRAIPQYNVGHAERVQAVHAQAARWPGLWLSGNAYGGASVPDCLKSASTLARRLAAGGK